jgi:hypothetical protein
MSELSNVGPGALLLLIETWQSDPIAGKVQLDGRVLAFRGWVELVAMVEEARRLAAEERW